MNEFKANKGVFWIYILVSLLFPVVIVIIIQSQITLNIAILGLFLPFIFFVWIYFSTNYKIKNNFFYYESAFLKGKIEINKISEIQVNKTLWSGVKPAMATKGMIIKYGFDEVYVAPQNNNDLVNALLQINPDIIIK